MKKLDARVSVLEKGGGDSKPFEASTKESKPAKEEDDDDDFDPFADDDDVSIVTSTGMLAK